MDIVSRWASVVLRLLVDLLSRVIQKIHSSPSQMLNVMTIYITRTMLVWSSIIFERAWRCRLFIMLIRIGTPLLLRIPDEFLDDPS